MQSYSFFFYILLILILLVVVGFIVRGKKTGG
jgi:hypothetical protein